MFKIKSKILCCFVSTGVSALLLFVVFAFAVNISFADDATVEQEIQTLEQKAQNYQRMIDLKQQQQMSLQNQLQMMDIQIDSYQNDIGMVKRDIDKNNLEIKKIGNNINQKEEELDKTKENLSGIIRLYHQIDQELRLEFLSAKENFTEALNHSEYIDQTSQKVDEILQKLRVKKIQLEEKQLEYRQKSYELSNKKVELDEKISYAGNEKLAKNILLNKTHGEETRYQTLLGRVEEQKQELIGNLDDLSSDTRDELDSILAKAPKPKSGKASNSWYYAQDDKKWGYKRIGLSSSLMKDYGCAVTSLAMVFSYHKEEITPGRLSSKPIFYRDLIVWPQHWKSLELDSSTAHGNINWSKIKKELKKDNPVVVFVRASAGKGHYVVIHGRDKSGNYVVHDPLFGSNLYLSTTQKLVGAIYGTSTTIDQMLIYKEE